MSTRCQCDELAASSCSAAFSLTPASLSAKVALTLDARRDGGGRQLYGTLLADDVLVARKLVVVGVVVVGVVLVHICKRSCLLQKILGQLSRLPTPTLT